MIGEAAVPPWSDQGLSPGLVVITSAICLDCWPAHGCHRFLWISASCWLPFWDIHVRKSENQVEQVDLYLLVHTPKLKEHMVQAGKCPSGCGTGQVVATEFCGQVWLCSCSMRSGTQQGRWIIWDRVKVIFSALDFWAINCYPEKKSLKIGVHLQADGRCVKIPQLLRTS